MNSTTLASYANLALYSSMAVFALAMLAYTGHLASLRPLTRADAAALARTPVLVGADGAAEHDGGEPPADAASEAAAAASEADFEPSPRSRRLAAVGLHLTWLATMLLAASVLMRGLSVMRPPWGNMFEFATAAACVAAIAFSVLARQNRWDWLGLFVVGPV
ncbi:MAG TPA: c-type cytochrome biogenesis protein CcsB, partial [Dermatophilaceae bacterium]|nr:c-type cytochrome biogenesis protein CcsB [Dermatophilaceae bacterium]